MNIKEKFSHIYNVAFRRNTGEQGSTLVVVLVMMVTMVTIAIGALKITQTNVASSGAHKKGKQAFYAAEVGLDTAVNDIVQEFENLSVYTTSAAKNGGNPEIDIVYSGYDVTYSITNPLDRFLYRTVVGNSTIFHYAYTFEINAKAISQEDNSSESLSETIRILETPLVQYFAFYAGSGDLADLELWPGTNMNMWGRIHANRDIYIRPYSGNVVLRNYDMDNNFSPHFMSMAGTFKGKRKFDGGGTTDSKTYVRKNNNLTIIGSPTTSSEFRKIPNDVNAGNEVTEEAAFNNYLLVNEKALQAPGQKQFWRNGFYEDRSEDPQNSRVDTMKIIVDEADPTIIRVWVSRPALTEVTADIINGGTAQLTSDGSNMVNNPIEDHSGTTTFYDGRESRQVDFTDIDLNLLHVWYLDYLTDNGLNWAGDGMLIYASRSGTGTIPNPNNGTRLDAFRFKVQGGSQPTLLANTTFATDNPIYIQGDFNTINTKGVAIVADASNILSNSFTTRCNGCMPGASETTVNTAFFSGITPNTATSGGLSNADDGGLHNFARLHENWGNPNTLNINGSFVSLFQSTQADGSWCHQGYPNGGDSCYNRPTRAFGWDVRFEDPSFWPPFIPSIFSVERVGFIEG
jgi:hypothetical protein